MEDVKELFREINEALKEDISRAKGVKAVYEFQFHDEPSISFQLVLKEDSGYVLEGGIEKADCTLTMLKEDFKQMAKGKLNGTKAFMSGRLKIRGNMGFALRLQDILVSYNKTAN